MPVLRLTRTAKIQASIRVQGHALVELMQYPCNAMRSTSRACLCVWVCVRDMSIIRKLLLAFRRYVHMVSIDITKHHTPAR